MPSSILLSVCLAISVLAVSCVSTPAPQADSSTEAEASTDIGLRQDSSRVDLPGTDVPSDLVTDALSDTAGDTPQTALGCLGAGLAGCARCADECSRTPPLFGPGAVCEALGTCLAATGCSLSACLMYARAEPCRTAFSLYSMCQERCVTSCETAMRPRCGDGMVNETTEECDGTAFPDGPECAPLGFRGGQLRCTADCHLDYAACDGCVAALCPCCSGDRCYRNSDNAHCGPSCMSCTTGQACRVPEVTWTCVTLRRDGESCTSNVECAGEVCSDGRCFTGCVGSGLAYCSSTNPCCNPALSCEVGSGGLRQCCAPDGTVVGTRSVLCCNTDRFGVAPDGGFRCGG